VDLRAGLDTEARRKILFLCQAWIQLGEECDRLLQNVKLTHPLALTSAEKVNLILLILYSWSINVTVEFVLSEYVVKRRAIQKLVAFLLEKKKGWPLSDAVTSLIAGGSMHP
jgi:hypothetical protein